MKKRISKRISFVLALALLLAGFVSTLPVNAASTPDLKKANVKWDLKNNKTLKIKTKWSCLGVKQHTVKMTKFKIKNAKKKGYKQCSFTLTFNKKVKPTDKQLNDMFWQADELEMEGNVGSNGPFGGNFYYTVVDYKTGKSLEVKNKYNVTVTDSWKYTNYDDLRNSDDLGIKYPKKTIVNVKITYPKSYKNLAVGVGGYTIAPYSYMEMSSSDSDELAGSGVGTASGGGGIKTYDLSKYWGGKKSYSKETKLYSKKDKKFAHFMRIGN